MVRFFRFSKNIFLRIVGIAPVHGKSLHILIPRMPVSEHDRLAGNAASLVRGKAQPPFKNFSAASGNSALVAFFVTCNICPCLLPRPVFLQSEIFPFSVNQNFIGLFYHVGKTFSISWGAYIWKKERQGSWQNVAKGKARAVPPVHVLQAPDQDRLNRGGVIAFSVPSELKTIVLAEFSFQCISVAVFI